MRVAAGAGEVQASLDLDRRRVLEAARSLADEGLVVGTTGNVSLRRADQVLVTPTRLSYARMSPADVVLVSVDGTQLAGDRAPSRELPLHLAVYMARPDVGALVHTHSPHATAWSFLGEPLAPEMEDNAYYGIGTVRTSRPAAAGTAELAEYAADALADSAAVLLGGHGVLATGSTLEKALEIARVIEHQAQVAWLLRHPRHACRLSRR
jgi:L-fuculose-phosphate aldolase